MALIINGVSLPPGSKQYWGTTHVRDIYMNGTHVYHYDSTPPTITITSSTAATATAQYTLTGVVTDADSPITYIAINSISVPIGAGGTFSKTFTLSMGDNNFTVTAIDAAGNRNDVSFTKTMKVPGGFTTDLTGWYDYQYSFMDWTDRGHIDLDISDNNYYDTGTLQGRCGGFQHGGHHILTLEKLIPIGQTNVHINFDVDGAGQHSDYVGGCEYARVEIYDINGNLVDTVTLWEGQIIYATVRPHVDTNVSLVASNDGAHFIRFTAKYGFVAAGEWGVFSSNTTLSFS